MNLNLDFSAVPRALRGMLSELRQKKLWPVALLLLGGIVAVPVLLSSSSSAPEATAQLPSTPTPATGTTLRTLNVQTTPAHSKISGSARNPFGGAAGGTPTTTTTAGSAAPNTAASAAASTASSVASGLAGNGGASPISSSTTSSSSGGGSSAPTSTTGTNPASIVPNAKPKPAPSGLTSTESYDVSLAITNASGGVDTIDPLERDSVLPNQTEPRLVELGVLQGGKRVLFAVQPGTVVVGPGTCTPGPIYCEILSLREDQTESVAAIGSGKTTLFAVTGVSATNHGSVAAANRARRASSAAGRALLNASTSSALSLFQYEPSLGYVVDMRNLTVGDS
jgi:hypothetical protein